MPMHLVIDYTSQLKYDKIFHCDSKPFDHTNNNDSLLLNVHCFIWLSLTIPIIFNSKMHYIKISIEYKLYDKFKSKFI
ncbi:hypothetical protein UT300018_12320 [Clostridium faecium]